MEKELVIVKSSGEKVIFSTEKLEKSLLRSGASKAIADCIVEQVSSEVYEGISTKEIYNRAYALLRQKKPVLASRYKLKKAIHELGPTGFPFKILQIDLDHFTVNCCCLPSFSIKGFEKWFTRKYYIKKKKWKNCTGSSKNGNLKFSSFKMRYFF